MPAGASSTINGHAQLAERVVELAKWPAGSFVLEPLVDWSDARVEVIVARKSDSRGRRGPVFARLPNGTVISNYDDQAFARLAAAVFTTPSAADGPGVAQLAVLFAAFGKPVGVWAAELPGSAQKISPLPRPSAAVAYTAKGAEHHFAFYTFDFELFALYDCAVVIGAAGVRAEAKSLGRTTQ